MKNFSLSSALPLLPTTVSVAVLASLLAACGGGSDDAAATTTEGASAAAVAPLPEPVAATQPAETLQALAAASSRPEATALAVGRTTTGSTTTATTTASTANCGLGDIQAAVMARINQLRAMGATCGSYGTFVPAAALTWNAKLLQAAAGHSQDMATNNYFSHTSRDGRTFVDRINATGYVWSTLGENIAAGYTTVNAVIDGWIKSPGHCANLMNPNVRDVGVACVSNAASTYRTYWTMDLGRSR